MDHIIQQIFNAQQQEVFRITPVSGGDINQAFDVETATGHCFLKLNNAHAFPGMFACEAAGLKALQAANALYVPAVLAQGVAGSQQYLVLEMLHKSQPAKGFWQQFAQGLAQLHQHTHPTFGWTGDNYIGSLVQHNQPTDTWAGFYAHCRLQPLAKILFDEGSFSKADMANLDALADRLQSIFPPEPPALLHGDLWAGNFMAVSAVGCYGIPCIYDPAVYFGHREMDLGMSLLFGGFDAAFYAAYNECFPLENNWKRRVPITQLYPLLMHAVLFGGGYVGRCREVLGRWR